MQIKASYWLIKPTYWSMQIKASYGLFQIEPSYWLFLLARHTLPAPTATTTHLAGLRALGVELHLLDRQLAAGVSVIAEEDTAKGALAQQLPQPPVGGGARCWRRTGGTVASEAELGRVDLG